MPRHTTRQQDNSLLPDEFHRRNMVAWFAGHAPQSCRNAGKLFALRQNEVVEHEVLAGE